MIITIVIILIVMTLINAPALQRKSPEVMVLTMVRMMINIIMLVTFVAIIIRMRMTIRIKTILIRKAVMIMVAVITMKVRMIRW